MKIKTKQYDIFFVDDDPKVCSAVADNLKDLGCKVTCFNNAVDCLEQLPNNKCDLLITDVKMPGMDGLTLLNRIKRITPWVSVMVITGFGDIPMSVRAIKLGAVDFIEKPLDRMIFLKKVQTILRQDDFIDSPVSKPLTKIEKKVLKLILEGKTNKETAYKLNRAVRTIEEHRSNIYHKFGVDNTVDLVKKTALINHNDTE